MICIIPARGGSQRIPGKNIKDFYGKPIIAYSIEAARKSELFDGIYVSTDSARIMAIANEYGAFHIERRHGMEVDEVGTQEVMKIDLTRLRNIDRDHFACCLYATAPLITAEDLQDGFRALLSERYPYVMSTDRFAKDVGGFYFGYTHAFLTGIPVNDEAGNRIVENVVAMEVADIDINTPEDWARAEKLYEERYGQ